MTAKHVIDGIASLAGDRQIYIRFNLQDGGVDFLATDAGDWKSVPPEVAAIDVAVLPWPVTENPASFRVVPVVPNFVTDELIAKEGIGPGDDLFLSGLFVQHYGAQRNAPIVRMGNIAAMPGEPVQTNLGAMRAYLIESRSVGGLSGSPVFVEVDPLRSMVVEPFGGTVKSTSGHLRRLFFLLGVMHGHWDGEYALGDGARPLSEVVNMGIAIVVPAQSILQVLKLPDLVADRRAREELRRQQKLPPSDLTHPDGSEELGKFEELT